MSFNRSSLAMLLGLGLAASGCTGGAFDLDVDSPQVETQAKGRAINGSDPALIIPYMDEIFHAVETVPLVDPNTRGQVNPALNQAEYDFIGSNAEVIENMVWAGLSYGATISMGNQVFVGNGFMPLGAEIDDAPVSGRTEMSLFGTLLRAKHNTSGNEVPLALANPLIPQQERLDVFQNYTVVEGIMFSVPLDRGWMTHFIVNDPVMANLCPNWRKYYEWRFCHLISEEDCRFEIHDVTELDKYCPHVVVGRGGGDCQDGSATYPGVEISVTPGEIPMFAEEEYCMPL